MFRAGLVVGAVCPPCVQMARGRSVLPLDGAIVADLPATQEAEQDGDQERNDGGNELLHVLRQRVG